MPMSKMDDLARRLGALQLDMERRFGQLRAWLLALTLILLLTTGQDSPLASLILRAVLPG